MDDEDFKPDPSYFGFRGHGSTAEGSVPLRDPFVSGLSLLQNSAKNTDVWLSPRKRKRKNARSVDCDDQKAGPSSYVPSFSNASAVHSKFQKLSFEPTPDVLADRQNVRPQSRKKSKVTSPQKNTLLNHFFTRTSSPKKETGSPASSPKKEYVSPASSQDDVQFICAVTKEIPTATDTKDRTDGQMLEKKETCDPYGLLGMNDSDDWLLDCDMDELESMNQTQPCLMTQLPDHILEDIFAHLPLTQALLDVSLVCTRFRNIVHNPKYLVWKKRYHGLKARRKEVVNYINQCFLDLQMNLIENVLLNLPRCLSKFRRSVPAYDDELLMCLKHHVKYSWAVKFLNENVADLSPASDEHPDPWLVVGALVVLSDSVADISRILQLLSRSHGSILQDLIEALYCLATLLYAVTTYHKALYGPHYYVFYALYLFENEWQAKVGHMNSAYYAKGQQNILKYSEGESNVRMTHEQMRIINHSLKDKQVVKVVAFAGTGKTSTLIQFAKLRQGLKFLLVVYNKAAQTHASRVFPGNVECRTMSSLAYQEGPGHKFRKNLSRKVRPLDIIPFLQEDVTMDRNSYARHVLSAIEKFMASADHFLTLVHVATGSTGPNEEAVTEQIALCIVRDAERIWKKMSDPNDWEVRALHETYLKLYQLQRPVWQGYSCVMIDEAQDCTPAMLDIILHQNCPKILVGDPNQQIYSFRGAINALESVQSTHTYYLTQSFRFGPKIAYIAHCTLALLKNVTHQTLVGGKQKSDVMGHCEGQLAIIARGNATLFNEAVRLLCKGDRRPHEPKASSVRPAFVGGLATYGLDQLVNIYHLMKGSKGSINDKFIGRFASFQSLQTYAKKAKDTELHVKIKLVLTHEDNIPSYVDTISRKSRYSVKDANVVFTTAHKAKGLEFDTVCLTDDFRVGSTGISTNCIVMELLSRQGHILPVSVDQHAEYNILYVALTRAKKCLLLSETANIVLRACHEFFEVPVLLQSDQETCINCGNPVVTSPNKSFVLFKKSFSTMSRMDKTSGLLCIDCAGPCDLEDSNTGFFLKDKSRHAVRKVLGSEVKATDVLPFDGPNIFLNYDLFIF